MKNIIIIFIGFIFLFGCTKDGGNLYIEGRVYNPVTGEGIEGVTFTMYRTKPLSGIPSDSKDVARVTTDVNGYYKMSHFGGGLVYYVNIQSGTGGYYLLGWANDNIGLEGKYRFQIPKGKNVTADYEMVPYAGIRNHIENVNCQGTNDNFKLYYLGSEIEPKDEAVLAIEGDGCFDYIREKYASIPMGERYYKWEVTKNGVTNTYYDTLDLDAGEEYTFEILY